MHGNKKTSLNFYIIKFVFKIGISVFAILLVSFIVFNNFLNSGILLPADHSEKLIVQFQSETLRRLIPYPELTAIGIIAIILIIVLYVFTLQFSNKMKKELNKFSLVTEKIEQQDLDFKVQRVYFAEYQKVMDSLDSLRLSLKKSLTTQFEEEKNKREQISALAHDIKIPITIIKGNAELLNLTQKDNDALDYTSEIIEATNQIQEYIQLLVDISQNEKTFNINRKEQKIKEFINIIEKNTRSSIGKHNIYFKLNNYLPKDIIWSIDSQLMERAVMNIIINALEHTPEQKSLNLEVSLKGDFVSFVITDEGNGFSNEAIKRGKEMFYTSDKSRSQTGHYGIGLAFADKVIQAHKGTLQLANSPDTCGGQVLILVPL